MDRRSFLAVVGSAALSGCGAVGYRGAGSGRRGTGTESATEEGLGLAERGFPSTVCEEEPKPEFIPAVQEPAFAPDWSGVEVPERYRYTGGLAADSVVLGLTAGDRARAYPLTVLRRHETVNDSLGGPLLVTYCPLCRSGMVAERVVDGEPTRFGVSGLLWQAPGVYAGVSEQDDRVFGVDGDGSETDVRNTGNLVLYDAATGSYWSQILARAICGPREGDDLEIRPSTVATWDEWRRDHPETDVLLPPPHSGVGNPQPPS